MINELVFDRTKADVDYANAKLSMFRSANSASDINSNDWVEFNSGYKGAYNYIDFNRVESWAYWLSQVLNQAGYPCNYIHSKAILPEIEPYSTITSDWQLHPYLYSNGNFDITMNGYISTISMYKITPGYKVTLFTNIMLSNDSGFLWYDSSKAFISGAPAANINGMMMTSSAAPKNAAYCKININKAGVIPASANGALIAPDSPIHKVILTDEAENILTDEAGDILIDSDDILPQWNYTDITYLPNWQQYIANVQALRNAFYVQTSTPPLPQPEDGFNIDGVNAIEQTLYDIYMLIQAMQASYRICGTFRSGNNAVHLPLKRS